MKERRGRVWRTSGRNRSGGRMGQKQGKGWEWEKKNMMGWKSRGRKRGGARRRRGCKVKGEKVRE